MLRTVRGVFGVAVVSVLAAACATGPSPDSGTRTAGSKTYKVGIPYEVGDTWYYPHEQFDYDETGIASWYGPSFYGKPTASGEIYDGDGLTAAHRTLPMPVNVRVTNLDNGKSIVLRVNDRGPFAQGRIIDVSRHAAELLGFYQRGTARVRVTYLGRADLPAAPTPNETPFEIAHTVAAVPGAKVRSAPIAVATRAAPAPVRVASLDAPPPPPSEVSERPPPTPSSFEEEPEETSIVTTAIATQKATGLYVQAGTFSSLDNAERLQTRLADAGMSISPVDRDGRPLYRVRSGPYGDLESANAALAKLNELGNNGAQIVIDR